jgi:hypothetical protein
MKIEWMNDRSVDGLMVLVVQLRLTVPLDLCPRAAYVRSGLMGMVVLATLAAPIILDLFCGI